MTLIPAPLEAVWMLEAISGNQHALRGNHDLDPSSPGSRLDARGNQR